MEQLTPGRYAVARGRDRLQVGLGDRRTAVSRTPEATQILAALASGSIRLSAQSPLTRQLRSHGLVTKGPVPPGLPQRLACESPAGWRDRLEARERSGVQVLGDLDVDPRPLLEASGLGRSPSVTLVLGRGAPDPAHVDPLIRANRPHVTLTCTDAEVTVGPFVVPGETACSNCLRIHRSHDDPELPDVERRYREASEQDTDRPPDNPVLLGLAMAWAVRDLTAWIDGEHPTTWSSTVRFGPYGPPEFTVWLRHPECGCGWSTAAG